MKKKFAIIIKQRQSEALRMAVGLTLNNNDLAIFVLDSLLDKTDESVTMSLNVLSEMGIKICSNVINSGYEFVSTEDIAFMLLDYDQITAY